MPPTRRHTGRPDAAALAALLLAAAPVHAGGVTGAATEWTQLLNNAELAAIATTEGAILSTETESLAAQLEQLSTQISAYEVMLRNIRSLPERHLRDAMDGVLGLQRIGRAAGAVAGSGAALDGFLRSGLVTDPLFDRDGLDRARVGERYDAWQGRWRAALETGLRGADATLADVETEARLVDLIGARFGTEDGQMQVLQGASQMAASMARQMNDLRALTAVQAEQNAIAWGRTLADLDRREAEERRMETEIDATVRRLDARPPGRSMRSLFGLGDR